MVSKILNRPTLVLNRNWQPVNVATVARALVLLWNQSARVVDPADFQLYTWDDWSQLRPGDGERFIRAVPFRLRVPEVIALSGYDRLPAAAVTFSRRNIFKRDHYTCQDCGAQPGGEELTLDHVIPRAPGGQSRWDNCVLACVEFNKRKADRTPEQAKMRLRRPPVQPDQRFASVPGSIPGEDTQILTLEPDGTATVSVNLRWAWHSTAGAEPERDLRVLYFQPNCLPGLHQP